MNAILTMILALAFALAANGAESGHKASTFGAIAEATEQRASAPMNEDGTVPPEELKADLQDYARHLRWQREFARDSWNWHLGSTKLLMAVVLAIVAFGLFITYIQFTRDTTALTRAGAKRLVKAKNEKKGEEGTDDENDARSTLKIGLDGLEITSQVIGLLVLALSLAFFYLYIKDVYPMQEVELQKEAKLAAKPVAEDTVPKK